MQFWTYLRRALLLRCPSCGRATLVLGPLRIHDQCRDCGLYFMHDEGTWLGAWHFNYFISAIVAIVPAFVGIATGAWSGRLALAFALVVTLILPILLYWHSYSLWIATYYYFVPDDLRMGQDRPPLQLSAEEEAMLSPSEREQLWLEEALLDLEGDRRRRVTTIDDR